MLVRGTGIRDVGAILKISITKVLKTLVSGVYARHLKRKHYDCLETDEFWTYVGGKKNKIRLIYAYHRETEEIAAYVRGKRDLKTAEKLRKRLKRLKITYNRRRLMSGTVFRRLLLVERDKEARPIVRVVNAGARLGGGVQFPHIGEFVVKECLAFFHLPAEGNFRFTGILDEAHVIDNR